MKQMEGGSNLEHIKNRHVYEHLKYLSKTPEINIDKIKPKPIRISNEKTKTCKLKLQKQKSNLKIIERKGKQKGGDKLNGGSK